MSKSNKTFFEGQDRLKDTYLQMLCGAAGKPSTLYVIRDEFVWENDWGFLFGDQWRAQVRTLMSDNNIQTKLLINDSKLERAHKPYYSSRKHLEYRFLPTSHRVDHFVTYVLCDTVTICSLQSDRLVGMTIADANIAKNHIALFEALWSASK